MAKASKTLKNQAKKIGLKVTVKRGKKRIEKSAAVLKKQIAAKKGSKRTTVRSGSSRPKVKVKGYNVKGHKRKARKFG